MRMFLLQVCSAACPSKDYFFIFFVDKCYTQLKEIDKSFLNKHKDPVSKGRDLGKKRKHKGKRDYILGGILKRMGWRPKF